MRIQTDPKLITLQSIQQVPPLELHLYSWLGITPHKEKVTNSKLSFSLCKIKMKRVQNDLLYKS